MTEAPDVASPWPLKPHAYHLNLPPHHMDSDGVPHVTKFAQKKARRALELAHSIELTELVFLEGQNELKDETRMDESDDDDNDETMVSIMKKCARLQAQITTVANLKHSGVTQIELCNLILHLLRLVTATVTIETDGHSRNVTLFFENVGYLFNQDGSGKEDPYESPKDASQLELELARDFALPTPARESLLSVLIALLSKKGPLSSMSNAALFPEEDTSKRMLLILHWKVLLRMLLRTAPYLDEHKVGTPPTASNSRQGTIQRRSVHLIRNARHFFDQGIRPPHFKTGVRLDATARDVWEMVQSDLLYHTHTNSCYRACILLYLFQPSICSAEFYLEVMPDWVESWNSIDRCPEFDFLWLVMFCRARKHVTPDQYDWGRLRRRLLTHCQYWLQLPVGGRSGDKSFPNAASPRTRSCPARLKSFVGVGSSYEEGIDFIAKVAKLLVAGVGTNDHESSSEEKSEDGLPLSHGTEDLLRFLSFVTPYFNPSNIGSWTFTLGAFLHYFTYEFCHRIGMAASLDALQSEHPTLAAALCKVEPSRSFSAVPPREIVALMDALLPLCQQSLYSKNGNVSRAGEAAMVYLTQIDPVHVSPPFLDFATSALDYSAVNLAHQAPVALSAMTRVVQPALRRNPSILLSRLPDILRLSLAGIDSNDQNKTIRTLILYRNLTSWIPVGGLAEEWAKGDTGVPSDPDGTIHLGANLPQYLSKLTESSEYLDALRKLPESSLLHQQDGVEYDVSLLVEEASLAMSDWSLAFLDRIYELLRSSGEREKNGKTASGVASRHSSADVQQSRNFSRVLKECLVQVFVAMDEITHKSAVRSVGLFLEEETLPLAAKDASALCQAAAAARNVSGNVGSPGLSELLPVLVDELDHHSDKTVIYRLRCLAGAVRRAGHGVYEQRVDIKKAIEFALSSHDRHVFKTGCKLLRHTLASQCEPYLISSDATPRNESSADGKDQLTLGKSAHLKLDPVAWFVPNGAQIDFAYSLLGAHVVKSIDGACGLAQIADTDQKEKRFSNEDMQQWRRTLRIIRYGLRGGSGILLDIESKEPQELHTTGHAKLQDDFSPSPHERAVLALLNHASVDTRESLMTLRGQICAFAVSLCSAIASEMAEADSKGRKLKNGSSSDVLDEKTEQGSSGQRRENGTKQLLSSDTKVCKEVTDLALLLLTRRGASFRCQEAKSVWKAQKQLITDYVLASVSDSIAATLHRASMYGAVEFALYKDGEDGGKVLPRRLLGTRVQLFYESLQRNASFEIPRRLRRQARTKKAESTRLFTAETSLAQEMRKLSLYSEEKPFQALDCYEGLVDGLFALSCHTNSEVRSSGFGVIDYIVTRFGWVVQPRISHLLLSLQLSDDKDEVKYGIPSCAKLSSTVDSQGKHKRLAEVIKGVCSILALPRSIKSIHEVEASRFTLIQTLCGTEKLMSLLPPEEMQKMIYYLHGIFSPYRSKLYSLPHVTENEQSQHIACLTFLMDLLQESDAVGGVNSIVAVDGIDEEDAAPASAVHWRNRLLVGWFLISSVNRGDLAVDRMDVPSRLWSTCFQLLENEMGQPIQRVAVGLFGRLVSYALPNDARLNVSVVDDRCGRTHVNEMEAVDVSALCSQIQDESFCRVLGKAIVFDHREDTSVGGGHRAQWSAGVEEILRDASSNVASRTLFPFQRTSRSSSTFKVQHAQLIESLLLLMKAEKAQKPAEYLLAFAKEMANAPPSEDQRNQQCSSAELFAGVCRAMLQLAANPGDRTNCWKSLLLPFLEDVIPKIPISLSGAFFDAFRYGIHFFPPSYFFELTDWIIVKIEASLWQLVDASETDDDIETTGDDTAIGVSIGADGFALQSKWLYLTNAILVELDEETDVGCVCRLPWYSDSLLAGGEKRFESGNISYDAPADDMRRSWKLVCERLLPRLLDALGHPYESCRDHIAGCLFRICYCHRKMERASLASNQSHSMSGSEETKSTAKDPCGIVVQRLSSVVPSSETSFKVRYNALITARKFISYCLHVGDSKHEYSDFVIPLLPLAFESLTITVEDNVDNADEDSKLDGAKRALEAEVVKGFRYSIAEVSSSSVIYYGKDDDITRVLDVVKKASEHEYWQVRHAATHFLRCFQGYHKFLYHKEHAVTTRNTVAALLADERREVSSGAMAALTGILAATPMSTVDALVKKYVGIANRSKVKRKKAKLAESRQDKLSNEQEKTRQEKEAKRAINQQTSVFFLCAVVLSRPYDTPRYVPEALAAISKHSFERGAPLVVRDAVKKCCAEFKRTHMSDNWEVHRRQFTQEQLEALDDVVSSPHYYA